MPCAGANSPSRSDLAAKFEPLSDDLAEAYFTGRYQGFDLDETDWPTLRDQLDQVAQVLTIVKTRVG